MPLRLRSGQAADEGSLSSQKRDRFCLSVAAPRDVTPLGTTCFAGHETRFSEVEVATSSEAVELTPFTVLGTEKGSLN